MGTLTIDWTLPTTRVKGGELSASEIDSVLIEMSANNGGNWSEVGPFASDILQTEVFDVDPGTYLVRGTVRDKMTPQGVSKAKLADPAVVSDTSPPNPLPTISVTVT